MWKCERYGNIFNLITDSAKLLFLHFYNFIPTDKTNFKTSGSLNYFSFQCIGNYECRQHSRAAQRSSRGPNLQHKHLVAILLPTRISYCIIGTKDTTTGVNSKEKINICEAKSVAYAVATFKSWSLPKIYPNLTTNLTYALNSLNAIGLTFPIP